MSFDLINGQIHIFMFGDSRVNPRKAIYILFPSITHVHKLNNSLSGIKIVAKNGTLRKTETRESKKFKYVHTLISFSYFLAQR